MSQITFAKLGRMFLDLCNGSDLTANRFDGRWKVEGGTPEQREEFKRLSAIGARMLGFVG